MGLTRKDIEERLNEFTDVSKLSCFLSEKEKGILFEIALEFAVEAMLFEEAGNKALGVNVAQSLVRNYLFALLTGNAVMHLKKQGIMPTLLEMGMGSGLNAVAAFVLCKDMKYIGVERDALCISFAKAQFKRLNVGKAVHILKQDYQKVALKKKVDIIINENFSPNLVEEPQVLASNTALQCAHEHTLFIPLAMHIVGRFDGKRKKLDTLEFSQKLPYTLSYALPSNTTTFLPGSELIDFNGVLIRQKNANDYISHLPLLGEKIPLQVKGKKITFEFLKRRIVLE